MKKIYISRSNSVPANLTQELVNWLKVQIPPADVRFWTKGTTYNDSTLIASDVVIILIESSTAVIGKGTFSEYQKANKYGKTVYLAYKRHYDDSIQLYTIQDFVVLQTNLKVYAKLIFGKNVTTQAMLSFYPTPSTHTTQVDVNVTVKLPQPSAEQTHRQFMSATSLSIIKVKKR